MAESTLTRSPSAPTERLSGTEQRIGLAERVVAGEPARLAAEAGAELDHEVLGAVADDLVALPVRPAARDVARDRVVAGDRSDRAAVALARARRADGGVAGDHAAESVGVVQGATGARAVGSAREVGADARRRQVAQVEREDVRIGDAELVLDQLLERLERARRRRRRELGGVRAAVVRPLEAELPLVERRPVGDRVAVVDRELNRGRRRRADGRERAGDVGDRRIEAGFAVRDDCGRPGRILGLDLPLHRGRRVLRRGAAVDGGAVVEDRHVLVRREVVVEIATGPAPSGTRADRRSSA